jgi:hypothetical protein
VSRELAVLIKDDFTGEPADTTLYFGLDRTNFRIDLTDEHARKFREFMLTYAEVATEVPALEEPERVTPAASKREYNRLMREYASREGMEAPRLNKGGYYYSKELQAKFAAAVEAGEVKLS